MSRLRTRRGDGTAWLVADRSKGGYVCYWYVGTGDGHFVESERVETASAAVAWGRLRARRVRIRTAEGRAQWAGTADPPEGFGETWAESPAVVAGPEALDPAGSIR